MGVTDRERGAGCDPERVADVLAALASPWRLEIVALLADAELDVSEIATRLGLSVANASHHLVRMRRAGLVVSARHGTRITNRLAGPQVAELCRAVCDALPAAHRSPAATPR